MANQPVRVRIAPSPTGNVHVGTARAALFNELFARKMGGRFIIRIEDTDKARSTKEFEANILEGFKWLGLSWDEGPDVGGEYGPYRQSERTEMYAAAIKQLLDEDKAYIDESANKAAPAARPRGTRAAVLLKESAPPIPSRTPPIPAAKPRVFTGSNNVIRLRVVPQTVEFTDHIRGKVSVTTDAWGGDFVIARSTTDPVFHLAVVVDDAAMKITHVIRGEDHLSNTARHILIQRALGYPTPEYAHLPLLLDEQRKKLSKRVGEVSLLAYRDLGYLPQAVLNYLALLGWSPKNDQEFFTHEELVDAFTLEGIQKGGAIFSVTKLDAVNKQYLRQLSSEELLAQTKPFLNEQGITVEDDSYWQAALACEQERSATLKELAAAVTFFKPDGPGDFDVSLLIWKKSTKEVTMDILTKLQEFLQTLGDADFAAATLQEKLMAWIDKTKLGRGDILWPLRVALTGREHSPGPFEVAAVLGKVEALRRLQDAFGKLTSS